MNDGGMLAVAGENIIDLVPYGDEPDVYRALPGGSPANTAIAAHRLGTPTTLLARVSTDTFGDRIRARLAADGIDDSYLVSAVEPSSLAVVSFDPAGSAHYDFWLDGTADWGWRTGELQPPLPDELQALHVGSIAVHREPGASTLLRLVRAERERGRIAISLDPNVRPAVIGNPDSARARVEELVSLAHVVKASDEDLHHLYPSASPLQVARRWLALGPALVAVTHGPHGAHLLTSSTDVSCPAVDVTAVDTVGAGDAFMGGLLHSLRHHHLLGGRGADELSTVGTTVLRDILRTATETAALTCTREGADPPTARELARHALDGV